MRRRIFLAFVLFTLAVLVLMWLFQTVFLSGLYRSVRTYETKRCASRLIGTDTDELGTEAARLADKYNICLSVYEIRGRRGDCVIKEHVYSDCFIHNTVSDSFLDSLYFDLRENGTYMKTVSLAGTRPGDTAKDENSGQTILYASLDERDGMEYMFLFNTEIYPLASTVSTIRLELVLVSVILVVIAAVLSVILSRRLARPAVKMSREASRLALGDYGVNFDGGGFREMDELASALNNASAELSELDRMQKDLIANVSHDLRTPLTLIRGYGEVMRDIPGEMNAENMQIIIDEYVKQYDAKAVVLGFPVNMDGSRSNRADRTEEFAALLRERIAVPVELLDERCTTLLSHRILNDSGKKAKNHKAVVDTLSAEIILQNYLDKNK